jgi:hypothetical protein
MTAFFHSFVAASLHFDSPNFTRTTTVPRHCISPQNGAHTHASAHAHTHARACAHRISEIVSVDKVDRLPLGLCSNKVEVTCFELLSIGIRTRLTSYVPIFILSPHPPSHRAGDQIDIHEPLHAAAVAYFEKDPCGFCADFTLPTYREVQSLADKLNCGDVRTPNGCVASETDVLLCILLRLGSEQSWKEMAKHPVYRTPGSRWSVSKMKDIFRCGIAQMVQVHSGTIGFNSFCFSPARAAVYTQAFAAKLGPPFNQIHTDIAYIVDGCLRSRTRSASGPQGQKIQNLYYNGWQHGHKDGYQSLQSPDGLHASVLGGFYGCINDQQKWRLSDIEATITAAVPGIKVLGDAGYTYAPGAVVVRCVPGGPFPPGHVFHAYNRDLAMIREPVEWGCAAI